MLSTLLNRFDQRELRLITAAIFGLLIAALFSYLIWPSIKVYRTQAAAVQILEQAANDGQEVGFQIDQIAAEVESLDRELNGDMANLADNELEAFVIGRLQTISWRSNIELLSVQPNAGETVQMFSESLFDVTLSGNYFDVFAWLDEIKEQLGFIVIKEFEMRPLEDVAENPELAVELTIASYRVSHL